MARYAVRAAPRSAAAAAPVSFDAAALEALQRMDQDTPGFFAKLTGLFLGGTPALIASVAAASGASAQDAQRAAHTLKSTSARFGARALAALAAQAEAAAREGRLDAVRELGEAMGQEFEQVRRAFATHLASESNRDAD